MEIIINFLNSIKHFKLHLDRSLSDSIWKQIGWLLFAFIVFFAAFLCIGSVIPSAYNASLASDGTCNGKGLFYEVLYLMIDPGSWTDNMHPWYAFAIAVVGMIIFVGCFISVLSNYFSTRIEKYQNGESTYSFRDHVVILGFDHSVISLIRSIIDRTGDNLRVKKDCYIVIVTDLNFEIVNRDLLQLSPEQKKRVVLHRGSRNNPADLRLLDLERCHSIYIIGEEKEKGHDDISLQAIEEISTILAEKNAKTKVGDYKPKKCFVKFDSQTALLAANTVGIKKLAKRELKASEDKQEKENKTNETAMLRLYPYNIYDVWAQKVLIPEKGTEDQEDFKSIYKPIDGVDGISKDSKKHVHVIISEVSEMGMALAHQVAQTAHYPNFNRNDEEPLRTRITFAKKGIDHKMSEFQNRYEHLFRFVRWRKVLAQTKDSDTIDSNALPWNDGFNTTEYSYLNKNFLDIEFEFIDEDISSPMVRNYLKERTNDPDTILSVVLADKDQDDNFNRVITLPDCVKRNANQILVYQPNSSKSIEVLGKKTKIRDTESIYEILPFGMYNDLYGTVLVPEKSGQFLNKTFNQSLKDAFSDEDWEDAKRQWLDTNDSSRLSSICSSNAAYTYMRSAGIHNYRDYENVRKCIDKNIDKLATVEHTRWMTFNLIAGFRPFTESENNALNGKGRKEAIDFYNKQKKNYIHGCIRDLELFTEEFKYVADLMEKETDSNNRETGNFVYKDTDRKFVRSIPWMLQSVENEIRKNNKR